MPYMDSASTIELDCARRYAGLCRALCRYLRLHLNLALLLNLDLDLNFSLYLDLNLFLFQPSFEKPFASSSAAFTLGFWLLTFDFVRPPMLPSRQ